MSTLGGNKGERERNPNKPKFAALDINSLYRSTRGETFEPTTQKNAAPRKHGMQSLGKVPSARRPPANLPSLKAETSTPVNTPSSQSSNEQQQQTTTNSTSSASWADSNTTQTGTANVTSGNHNSASGGGGNQSTQSHHHHHHHHLQQQQQQQQQNNSSSSSSSWSAVAIGNALLEDSASQPPLYQSPQFQNEFPSLDGTLTTTTTNAATNVTNVNVNVTTQKQQNQNSFDSGGGLNLRPSTDAASWMQQQQQSNSINSGNARGVGGENGGQQQQIGMNNNFQTPDIGPPKVMALMPSFLRGGTTGMINSPPPMSNSNLRGGERGERERDLGGANQMNLMQKSNAGIGNNRNNNNNNRNSSHYNERNSSSSYNNDFSNGPRHYHHHRQSQPPPRHSSGRQNHSNNNNNNSNNNNNNNNNTNDDRSSSYEPEIVQRPIIKEEELERIDSLARDDAWSKHDEIDYNKKLQFSDDEADDMKPKDLNNDRKIDVWRDSEKREIQQNGPRSIDPSYVEKMKMVREEEERMERERKSAAQRKLQELDEKTKQKDKTQQEKDVEEKTISGICYTINDSDKKSDHHPQQQQQHQQQQQRDYSKSKYNNNDKYDTYDSQYGRNTGGTANMNMNAGGEFKKSQFQSNLPPRFLKQQQQNDRQDDRREKGSPNNNNNNNNNNNYKPLHQQDSKNIPFAQHPAPYEQRWIQYNKVNQQGSQQQQQQPRRNVSSLSQSSSDDNRQNSNNNNNGSNKSAYNRRRQESEDDDFGRFGKDTMQKKSTITSSATQQITRSMSDSSDKLSDHNRSEKSTSREYLSNSNVCWAEVCENDKRSSLDTKERRRVSESSAMSDDQPRTILQRNKPLQDQLQNKDMKKDIKEMTDEEQKSVLSDSTPKTTTMTSMHGDLNDDKKEKSTNVDQQLSSSAIEQNKKSLEIIPEKDQGSIDKNDDVAALKKDVNMKAKEVASKESTDDGRHTGGNKRLHSNRYESRGGGGGRGGSRGDSSYNSGYRGNNWQRRSGHSRGGGRYDYSDSENSEEYEHEWNRGGKSSSSNRKDGNRRENFNISNQKEGFSPRGEPSRRGRGGGLSGSQSSGSSFRRSGSNNNNANSITAPVKRIDNYGPPSSKSPFGSNDEKSSSEKKDSSKEKEKMSDDDRTKQKQKALSDGLLNKNIKDSSNLAMQKSSTSLSSSNGKTEEVNKQHCDGQFSTSINASNAGTDQKESKKSEGDDKASIDGSKNSNRTSNTSSSSSSYNANQNRAQKYDGGKINATSSSGKIISKPSTLTNSSSQQISSTAPSTASSSSMPATSQSSSSVVSSSTAQYNSSMTSKPIDSRNASSSNNNSNYRNDQRGANNNSNAGGNTNSGGNRMAPRFVKQQRDNIPPPNSNNRIVSGNYWDKNHPDALHDENKVSLMQQLNSSSNSMSCQQQQQQMSASNILNSKTDVMKQQQQQQQQQQSSQQSAANQQQQQQQQGVPMLDGASLPKQTLIFENTSYKSAPPPSLKHRPPQQQQGVLVQGSMNQKDSTPTINEMIEQQAKDHSLTSALQNLSFGQKQSDMVDMNFKFSFDTQLTDDGNAGFGSVTSNSSSHPSQASKASSLGLVGAKTGMQNSNILNTDALNMKVASCKKVWEEPSVDHSGSNADDVMANFVAQQHLQQYHSGHHTGLSPQSFGYATNSTNDHTSSLEHFNKSNDNDDSNSYPSPQQHMNAHVMHSQNQQANLNMKAAEAFATNANVCKVKPTQQQMHQSGLSPPPQLQQQNQLQQHQQTFYPTPNYQNMPTIPSPPVVYNSQATGGLYNPYNMDAARAQMYSYQAASNNNSLSFNAFMQTPNIASAPTHEMYQNLSQYRATVQPYNQTAQMNNPSAAVLISSATASNSMIGSKSNTPQQIGAIGSKSSVPQSAPPSSAAAASQYNQQYMNHLYHQNSYYPNSTAQQANPYYNATATAPATGNYGIFSGTNVNAPPQQPQMANYGSVGQYPLNSQMLNNLVYRGGPVVNSTGNSNGSGTSGSNSNTGGGGYMKQQQHQSQLQDPTDGSSHKTYNWDTSTSSFNRPYSNNQNLNIGNFQNQRMPPIQRPSSSSSYSYSQNNSQFPSRIQKNSGSSTHIQMSSSNNNNSGSQGKSQ